jgi:hypothetical protein
MTERQERPENEAAAKQLAEDKKVTEKSRQDFAERTKGKPTPTQEENDLAVLGAHIHEHEPDGSDPDPGIAANKKQMEAKKPQEGAGYSTRALGAEHETAENSEEKRAASRSATSRHPSAHSSS